MGKTMGKECTARLQAFVGGTSLKTAAKEARGKMPGHAQTRKKMGDHSSPVIPKKQLTI